LASMIPGLDKDPMTGLMSDSLKRTSAKDQDRGKGAVSRMGQSSQAILPCTASSDTGIRILC